MRKNGVAKERKPGHGSHTGSKEGGGRVKGERERETERGVAEKEEEEEEWCKNDRKLGHGSYRRRKEGGWWREEGKG